MAVVGGVLAGAVTLLVASLVVFLVTRGDDGGSAANRQLGGVIDPSALQPGDCIDTDQAPDRPVVLVACDQPHRAEVTERIMVTDEGALYPGMATLAVWADARCREPNEAHVGAPILSTTLDDDRLLPSFDQWARGETMVTCTVVDHQGQSLVGSVAGRGDELERGTEVPVARLMVGDCFTPPPGVESYDLSSTSTVELASCDGSYNGVLFGRGALDTGVEDDPFPGEEAISGLTGDRCAALFETTYGVEAEGFNYRFWRPNEASWSQGDRTVLCSILDAEPLSGPFDPTRYLAFFELGPGACFDLGPEESGDSLGLDDRVLETPCSQLHTGQMIGGGLLTADQVGLGATDPYPGDTEVEAMAGAECEELFERFVGISPYESELLRFPFWYPNETGWLQGDRRFACAFLHEAPRIGSLEGAEI